MVKQNNKKQTIFGYVDMSDFSFHGWFSKMSEVETDIESLGVEEAKILEVVSVTYAHLPPEPEIELDVLNISEELLVNMNK